MAGHSGSLERVTSYLAELPASGLGGGPVEGSFLAYLASQPPGVSSFPENA